MKSFADAEEIVEGLNAISWQLKSDIAFHIKQRAKEGLSSDADTALIASRFWHSHGQMERWIECFSNAAALIDQQAAEIDRLQQERDFQEMGWRNQTVVAERLRAELHRAPDK